MKSRLLLPIGLFVLAAALVVAGTLLLLNPRATGKPPADDAVIDAQRTSQVIGQVSTALNEVLSYAYDNPAPTNAAAAKWLSGDAVAEYQLLFDQLQRTGPNQQLTFVAKVVKAGVNSLKGDTAQLLVFIDQKSTRASDGQSSIAAAQVQITAVDKNGTWRITQLKTL